MSQEVSSVWLDLVGRNRAKTRTEDTSLDAIYSERKQTEKSTIHGSNLTLASKFFYFFLDVKVKSFPTPTKKNKKLTYVPSRPQDMG